MASQPRLQLKLEGGNLEAHAACRAGDGDDHGYGWSDIAPGVDSRRRRIMCESGLDGLFVHHQDLIIYRYLASVPPR